MRRFGPLQFVRTGNHREQRGSEARWPPIRQGGSAAQRSAASQRRQTAVDDRATHRNHKGAKIGILGQGFSSSSEVKFGGVAAASFTRQGTTFISSTVPAGALTGSVTVTTGATTLTSNQRFRVTPTILNFSPTSGPVGKPVMITGTGLTQTTKVTFGGVAATTFKVNTDSQVTANVPTGAVTGKIVIKTKGGSAASKTDFTVTQ